MLFAAAAMPPPPRAADCFADSARSGFRLFIFFAATLAATCAPPSTMPFDFRLPTIFLLRR